MNYSDTEIELFLRGLYYILIRHSDDERSICTSTLSYEEAMNCIRNEEPAYTHIKINEITYPIKASILYNIVKYEDVSEKAIEVSVDCVFQEINRVIHFESVDKMPLYINKYPEIVSWRLRIGK